MQVDKTLHLNIIFQCFSSFLPLFSLPTRGISSFASLDFQISIPSILRKHVLIAAMLYYLYLYISLFNTNRVDAFAAWQPNCTSPTQHVDYVSSPQVRGTMDIIWTCFAVLLLCTWTVQHLMVPVHKERKKESAIHRFREKVSFNYTKLKWMGWCIAAPEYILGKALSECLAAHDSRRQFREWLAANDTQKNLDSNVHYDAEESREAIWTTAHGFFANMRGFVLRFDVAAVPRSLEPSQPTALGRSRQIPRLVIRDGDPPYYEQEYKKTEATELEHCREFCGVPCKNRLDLPNFEDSDIPSNSISSPPYEYRAPTSEIEQADVSIEAVEKPEKAVMDTQKKFASLRLQTDKIPPPSSSTESTAVAPAKSPHFLHHDITTGLMSSAYGLGPIMPRIMPVQHSRSSNPYQPNAPAPEGETLGPHRTWKGTWALSAVQLLYACQKGIITGPPKLSTADLEDRSKGDVFIKGAALLQLTWLVIQMIARASEDLAISLLEVMTLAFAVCAIATYILLWHKPQDVMTPTYVDATDILTREQVIGLAARCPVSTLLVKEFWLHGVAIRAMADNIFPWTRGIPVRFWRQKNTLYLNPIFIGIGFGGVLFGTVHFIAWNFQFPTPVERILWRVSCCMIISIPLLGTGLYFITLHNARKEMESDTKSSVWLRPFTATCVLLYLLARLYLMTEVFRSLAYAPLSTFQEINWPSAIPHVN